MYFLTQTKNNVSALELKRLIGVCYRPVWRLKHKLIQVMCEREESTVPGGRVEVDDTYLGGEHPGSKAGRGSENKVPFVAAVETNDRGHPLHAVFAPVESFSSPVITAWARCWLGPLRDGGLGWVGLRSCGDSGRLRPSTTDRGNETQEHRDAVFCLGQHYAEQPEDSDRRNVS